MPQEIKAPFTRYNLLSNRLSNRFDNMLHRVYKHSSVDNRFDNRLYRVHSRLSNRLLNRLYNRFWQPVVSCKRGITVSTEEPSWLAALLVLWLFGGSMWQMLQWNLIIRPIFKKLLTLVTEIRYCECEQKYCDGFTHLRSAAVPETFTKQRYCLWCCRRGRVHMTVHPNHWSFNVPYTASEGRT